MSNQTTIDQLLKQRGARLKGRACDFEGAAKRAPLTRAIESAYRRFEPVRDTLLKRSKSNDMAEAGSTHAEFYDILDQHNMIARDGHSYVAADVEAKRYLSGGWLEELAWLAAREAGAHEALFAQRLSWQVGEYRGENEIDLIVRHESSLGFASCKALQADFDAENRKHRNRLMDALHEADNLADHFGQPGERVAVLVTTDLFDEMRDTPRYTALMGKAAALDVRIIPLEEIGWDRLVAAVRELVHHDNEGNWRK